MFSFIYFIWAFHLRKEILHNSHHPQFCIISPHSTPSLWTIKIFPRPDAGALNGFLQSFDHVWRRLGLGCFGGRPGQELFMPLGVATPQCFTWPSSWGRPVSFSLYHITPCPAQSFPDKALEAFSLSPVLKAALPRSLDSHVLLLKSTHCFCLGAGHGVEETSPWLCESLDLTLRAMGLSFCSIFHPVALSELLLSTLIHWPELVSQRLLASYLPRARHRVRHSG